MPSSLQTPSDADKNTRPATARWISFLLPRVTDLFFVALVLGLSCGLLGRVLLRDAGIGWHIRNGEQIWLTHSIPRADFFSSTMSGHAWYAWEWLYDLLIAGIHHLFGLNGVVFFSATVIAASFALALHFLLRRGANLLIAIGLLILGLGASAVHFLARPHVVTWLLAVVWFELLDSAAVDQRRRKTLFWLPILMILWVNLHGGFVLGFALVAIYFIGGSIDYFSHPDRRSEIAAWLKRLGTAFALTLAASFLNPYGYHLHVHVYRYLSDRFLMSQISEFLSPDFHAGAQQCFAVLLIVTIVILASARQKPSPSRLLVVLFAAYSGLYATRNLPTSSLLITLVVAPVLSETLVYAASAGHIAAWLRRCFSRVDLFGSRMKALDVNLRGHTWIVLVLASGLWACSHQGKFGSTRLINAYFDDKRFPVQATDYIAEQRIREPIFCPDSWGGYLIYRLYPETKVVLDDRHDLYGDEFIKQYLRIILVQPSWEKELDHMQVNWILVPRWSSLANILRLSPNWTTAHEDETAALFHRRP